MIWIRIPMLPRCLCCPVQRPAEIVNYRTMGSHTRLFLGAGLAAGAVAALGLTLIASVRRRRRDFAVLENTWLYRFVGWVLSSPGSRASAAGDGDPRRSPSGRHPRTVASGTSSPAKNRRQFQAPSVPVASIALIVLGGIVLANIVAAVPGRIAARTPAALLLRAE